MGTGDRSTLTFHLENGLYQHRIGSSPDKAFHEAHALAEAHADAAHALAVISAMTTEGLTPKQIKGGKISHTLQARMAFLSDVDLGDVVKINSINNLPISFEDVVAANQMYGRNTHSIRGKTTWS